MEGEPHMNSWNKWTRNYSCNSLKRMAVWLTEDVTIWLTDGLSWETAAELYNNLTKKKIQFMNR